MPKNILKRLTSIENTLLCESRKKRVIQKYPWITHTEDYKYNPSYTRPISFFTMDDPSPKKDNKYLEWLADQYATHINKYIKKSTEDYKEKWSFNDKDREQWLELAKDEKYMVGDNIVPWPVKNKSDYNEYLEFLKEFPTILATVKFDFENSWENMLLKSGVFNEEQIALFANKGDTNNED